MVINYEVLLDGNIYIIMNSDIMYYFNGMNFVFGKLYVISIVIVSGIMLDIVKKSLEYMELIRIILISKINIIICNKMCK